MRHVVRIAAGCALGCGRCSSCGGAAFTPAARTLRMRQPALARLLIPLPRSALPIAPGLARADRAAVVVTPVAAAAQRDHHATSRAPEQASRQLHAHPGSTEVLDAIVPASHTVVAPPSSARCRARRGRRACRQGGPLPCPPPSASAALYRGAPRTLSDLTGEATGSSAQPPKGRHVHHGLASPLAACMAALQGGHAGAVPRSTHEQTQVGCLPEPAANRNRLLIVE